MTARKSYRFAGLDYLRGIAILAVFGHHVLYEMLIAPQQMQIGWNGGVAVVRVGAWWQWLFYPFHFGALGVTLFFVISGFCIHWSYLQWVNKHPSSHFWPQYFVRRFYRIYPPYIACIVMIVAIGVLLVRPRNLPSMRDLVLHLFMVQNLDQDSFFKLTGSFWSLAVEWQLYLVYPLFLMLVCRFGFPLVLVLSKGISLLLPVAWNAIGSSLPPFWLMQMPFFYWFSWGLGAYVAERHFHGRMRPLEWRFVFWPLLVLSLVAAHFQRSAWITEPGIAIVCAVWVGDVLRPGVIGKSIVQRSLMGIGVISYSMYLFHGPLLAFFTGRLGHYFFGANLLALATVGAMLCGIVIVGISFLAWRIIELASQAAGKLSVKRLHFEA